MGELDLTGRTVALTGCNSGLGAEMSRVLALRGATVIALARTAESARIACRAIPNAIPLACELTEPASILQAVAAIRDLDRPLDAIIANAGIMAPPTLEQIHGIEKQFFTNHVGHHLLVTRLLDRLAPMGRIVVLSSSMHARAPNDRQQFEDVSGARDHAPWPAYGRSKLANILFAKHLATQLPGPGQIANAVHPGVIRTGLQRALGLGMRATFALGAPFFKTVHQGAATPLFAAVHPDAAQMNGEYLADCAIERPTRLAQDDALAARLWDRTEEIIEGLQQVR